MVVFDQKLWSASGALPPACGTSHPKLPLFLTATNRDIYSDHFTPKLKNREEFEGGLHEKKEGKRGEKKKKERVIKHTLKYLYELK